MAKSKLWNGNTMSNGALWIDPRGGKPKVMRAPNPTHGAVRQTVGQLSAYHHGIEQDDEPLAGNKTYLKTPELHPAMPNPEPLCAFAPHLHPVRRAGTDSTRGKHVEGLGQAVLNEAGFHGKKE